MDDRIEEVEERIEKARAKAEEDLGDPGQTFVESGNEQSERADDQTIAPPG